MSQIEGKLADNEWNLIYDIFNAASIDYRMSQKLLLQSQIENSCYYEGVDVKWAVDKEALLHKVNELDELK